MRHKEHRPGYIMIVTLMIIALMVVLVSYLTNRSTPFLAFSNVVTQREKAKMLALGGIQMGLSQLAWAAALPEGKQIATTGTPGKPAPPGKKQTDPKVYDKQFLETILPALNRWQTVELTEEKDGVAGKIEFSITCEQGKLNINEIYNFEQKKFIGEGKPGNQDYKKLMEEFFAGLEKKLGEKKLFDAFATFLKNRDYKLNDVTELLTSKPFEQFKNKIFYIPPTDEKNKKTEQKQYPLYLTDIFTVWSESAQIEPWLLSDSMCGLLNLEQAKTEGTKKREGAVGKWLESFKPEAKWNEDWDKMLAPVYGKKFNTVPLFIKPLLATRFGPTVFSVLSYGKVGDVTQQFLALVEKGKPLDDKDGRATVTIKKLYWL